MYPAAIEEYIRAQTIAEALEVVGRFDEGDALFLAGGQSAMQALKTRLLRPRCIVDLQEIVELRAFRSMAWACVSARPQIMRR